MSLFFVPSEATKEELLAEKERLGGEIKKCNGDYFLMYGYVKQLEAVKPLFNGRKLKAMEDGNRTLLDVIEDEKGPTAAHVALFLLFVCTLAGFIGSVVFALAFIS